MMPRTANRSCGWRRSATAAICCLQLGACVHPPGQQIPAREAAAIEANRRAEVYFRRGDLRNAVKFYTDALRISQSIEDVNGIAANSINLSIAYQQLGQHDAARASLAPLLETGALTFPPERMAQAALRRAVLDLDEHRFESAASWANKAAEHCGASGCALSAAIHNVRGQLALDGSQLEAATQSAKAALEAAKSRGDRGETANALRLLGQISIRAKDGTAAHAAFTAAYDIDRELAQSHKLYVDLIGLGNAARLRGEPAQARSYYERAAAVGEADRDSRAAAEARALIQALGESR